MMVHTIADVKSDEHFGFTDDEVRQILANYNLESHCDETRQWYDEYRFEGRNVYCPWDVIGHCYALHGVPKAKPKACWINTSDNDMVRRLIAKGRDGGTQLELDQRIAGETIRKTLNENLTHSEIDKNIDTSGVCFT